MPANSANDRAKNQMEHKGFEFMGEYVTYNHRFPTVTNIYWITFWYSAQPIKPIQPTQRSQPSPAAIFHFLLPCKNVGCALLSP